MKFVILGVVVLLVAYLAFSAWVAGAVVKIPRIPLGETPDVYEDVFFPSRVDNVSLSGWYMLGGPTTIIIANGGHQNRVDPKVGTLELARDLVGAGYNILLFDFRGRGESEGEGLVLTHTDRDLGGAVDFVRGRGCTEVFVIGFSTGGAAALAFEDDIAAMVCDSVFADTIEQFVREVAKQKGIPEVIVWLFTPGTLFMARVIYGFETVNPVDKAGDVGCPILFVHGELDDSVPVADAYRLHEASVNSSIWVMPSAGHTEGYKVDPVGYMDRVTTFFENR